MMDADGVLVEVLFANGESFSSRMLLTADVKSVMHTIQEQKGDHVGNIWIVDDIRESATFLKPAQTLIELLAFTQTEGVLRLGALLTERVAWEVYTKDIVRVSEDGLLAAMESKESNHELVLSGCVMTEGRHYWEIALREQTPGGFFVGVTRPGD
jgi:hypothetical protein